MTHLPNGYAAARVGRVVTGLIVVRKQGDKDLFHVPAGSFTDERHPPLRYQHRPETLRIQFPGARIERAD